MAAGTPPYIIEQTDYDPRTITLGDFIKLYETESTDVGGRNNSTWGNKIRKNAVYKDLLNEPVINILDATKQIDGKNIYKAAQDAAKQAKGDFQSKLRTIENNILPKIREIQAREGIDLSKFTSLTDTVPKIPTRGAKLTAETQFDSNKMGELVANLEDHVKKNPTDRPSANAILLLLEMGARPSLPTEIISSDYVETTVTTESEMLGVGVKNDGLHIPAERKGVKRQAGGQTPNVQPFNAPLSQRAITILQDQSRYNSETFGDNRRLDNFFQIENADGTLRPLELKDINDLLKIVTPPGTVRKLKDGKFVPTDNPLTSKNFRTIWTNIANTALNDQAKIAALQSRDVGTNTGSVAVYLGQAGDYQPAAVADLNEISRKSWGLYTLRNEVGKLEFTKGYLLSTSTFLYDTPEDERSYEVFGRGQAANVPIQVGGFSAPRADVDQQVKREAAQTEDPEQRGRVSDFLNRFFLTSIVTGLGVEVATSDDPLMTTTALAGEEARDETIYQAAKAVLPPQARIVAEAAPMILGATATQRDLTQHELEAMNIQAAAQFKRQQMRDARLEEAKSAAGGSPPAEGGEEILTPYSTMVDEALRDSAMPTEVVTEQDRIDSMEEIVTQDAGFMNRDEAPMPQQARQDSFANF